MAKWILEEFKSIALGDERLNHRARLLLDNLSTQPSNSIPTACGGWAETKAAYRFFENKKVTSDAILAPHKESTLNRVKKHSRVFVIQDTTELDYSGQKHKQGVGPTKSDNDRALLFHPSLIVTPERVCLGIYDDYQWHRKELQRHQGPLKKMQNKRLHYQHITEKESCRWLYGYRKATEISELCPNTQVIMISDRESDIYDIYDEAEQLKTKKADWLVRINKNRVLINPEGKRETQKLYEHIERLPPAQIIEFCLPGRNGEEGRKIKQELKVARVKLHPPTGRRGKLRLAPVETTVLLAKEIEPLAGKKPIIWWLMSNVQLKDELKPSELISWYLCRWQIEVFFRILKSGCQVEQLQLSSARRTQACLAMYAIIAWRILFLTSIAKIDADGPCSELLGDEEWKTAYIWVKKTSPPNTPPSIGQAVKLIAQMGGYLARKHDSPPGPKSLWQGITKLYEILRFSENLSTLTTCG